MKTSTEPAGDMPPFIRNWTKCYLFIIAWTAAVLLFFWFLTRYFS